MSLKDEVAAWQKGVDKAAEAKYDEAITCFSEIPEPGARILFNIASMYLKLGDLESAKKNLDQCLQKDPHHALAYFQRGSLFLQTKRYADALADFEMAQKNLRGNLLIDYKQLGLQYKLYSCEIMYNTAYAYVQLGRKSDAQEEIEKSLTISQQSSENRHKIISSALEDLRAGKSFLPYRLPRSCTVFCPPRNKTESLKPVDFLGKAKVLSSVVDKDDYTGFVGVQDMKQSSDQPPSSPRVRSKSPSPIPDTPIPSGTRAPKPSGAPPTKLNTPAPPKVSEEGPSPASDAAPRPPKPTQAPPSLTRPTIPSPPKSPLPVRPEQPTASREDVMMTVKIHYTSTRAIRISRGTGYEELIRAVCEKCEKPKDTLTLWFKKGPGELSEITSDASLNTACAKLEEGYRLTVWAYDKEQESSEQALKYVTALSDYKGQYGDELSFKKGDKLEVTLDVSNDWYEGKFQGKTGIFPKVYVEDAA